MRTPRHVLHCNSEVDSKKNSFKWSDFGDSETSLKITEKVAFYNIFEEVDFWQFSFDNFF